MFSNRVPIPGNFSSDDDENDDHFDGDHNGHGPDSHDYNDDAAYEDEDEAARLRRRRRLSRRASLGADASWSSSVWATLDDWNDNLEEYPLLSSLERVLHVQKVYIVLAAVGAVLSLVIWGYGMSLVVFLAGFVVPLMTTLSTISDHPSTYPQHGGSVGGNSSSNSNARDDGTRSRAASAALTPRNGSSSNNNNASGAPVSGLRPRGSRSRPNGNGSGSGTMGGSGTRPSAQFALRKHMLCYWIVFFLFSTSEAVTDWGLSWIPFYHLLKLVFLIWCYSPTTEGASTLFALVMRPVVRTHRPMIETSLRATARAAEATKGSAAALMRKASHDTLQRLRSASAQWVDAQDKVRSAASTPLAAANSPPDSGSSASSAAALAAAGTASFFAAPTGSASNSNSNSAGSKKPQTAEELLQAYANGGSINASANAGAGAGSSDLTGIDLSLHVPSSPASATPLASDGSSSLSSSVDSGANPGSAANSSAGSRGAALASQALAAAARAGVATAHALAALPSVVRDVKALFTPIDVPDARGNNHNESVSENAKSSEPQPESAASASASDAVSVPADANVVDDAEADAVYANIRTVAVAAVAADGGAVGVCVATSVSLSVAADAGADESAAASGNAPGAVAVDAAAVKAAVCASPWFDQQDDEDWAMVDSNNNNNSNISNIKSNSNNNSANDAPLPAPVLGSGGGGADYLDTASLGREVEGLPGGKSEGEE